MICPICGAEHPSNTIICGKCGWEFKQFPASIPSVLAVAEEERMVKAKANWQKLKSLETEVAELQSSKTSLMAQVEEWQKIIPYGYLIQSFNGVLQNVYPLIEGDNTFGSTITDMSKGQRQILEGNMAPSHFVINTSLVVNPKGRKKASYTIKPLSDTAVGAPGNRLGSLQPLPLLSLIYAGGLTFQILDNTDN